MAPTICSGKKRQTHTIASSNIRRHGQGPHHLNQALSNIVNFVAKGSVNPRISASLRIQTHNTTERNAHTTANYSNTNNGAGLNRLTERSVASAASHRHQEFSFISDNAVTSSTHADIENSLDLRLASEISNNDSTTPYSSNQTKNPSNTPMKSHSTLSELASLSSSPKRKTSSPISSLCQERIFQRFSTQVQANDLPGHAEDGSDHEGRISYENVNNNQLNWNKKTNEIHSSNIRTHYYSCNEFDSEEDELEDTRERNSYVSGLSSDTGMDTDESDSMTSLDTEKSAQLKRGNHPLLRDKILAKQQTNNNNSSNNNNAKSFTNIRNTDGLLSIAIKTIKLVQRNHLLQQRLTQLQLETSEFIQSVLANPENRHFRENIKQKV